MIEITIDTHNLDRELQRLTNAVSDMTPAMTSIGEQIASLIDETFVNQTDPYGNPWAALSSVTIGRRRQGGRGAKILQDTGHLKNSITSNPSRTEVEIGLTEKYAATHQFGASKGQYGRTVRNAPIPWGNIPARPFLPEGNLPPTWEQDIVNIIERHLS